MDKINAKRMLDSAYRAFIKNPSASNYVLLQQRMLVYQNTIKNH